MIKLHELEIKHLAEKGETVLFRRIDPQPRVARRSANRFEMYIRWKSEIDCKIGAFPFWMERIGHSIFGKPGDTVVTAGGLTLRIASVDVQELRPMLSGKSAGWHWRIAVEVAE